jgi:hypothetical protein
MTRLQQPTLNGKVNYIDWNARITRLYFVSASVIRGIWHASFRHNEALDQAYYRVPAYTLEGIVDNRIVRRRDARGLARDIYGLGELECRIANPLGHILTPEDHARIAPLLATVDPALFRRRR